MHDHTCNPFCDVGPNGPGKLHAILSQWPAAAGEFDFALATRTDAIILRAFGLEPLNMPQLVNPPSVADSEGRWQASGAARICFWGREP